MVSELKVEKTDVPIKQRGNVSSCSCILFKPSVGWMVPSSTEQDNLLYLVYCFKCSLRTFFSVISLSAGSSKESEEGFLRRVRYSKVGKEDRPVKQKS